MKKCLILCMSCNLPFFQKEEKAILETWGKDVIDGKYPNIKIAIYSASTDGKYHYNEKDHKILVPSGDDLHSTFEKTRMTFNLLDNIPKLANYDFILRTNCSTYINVKLLNRILDIIDENIIYCGNIDCNPNGVLPFEYAPHPMGSCMILSKKLISIIKDGNNQKIAKKLCNIENDDLFKIDDMAIGSILNCYWLNKGENILEHYQNFELWSIYACIAQKIAIDTNILSYSYRLYGATLEHREKQEIQYLTKFHDKIKGHLSDDLTNINKHFNNKYFKMLFPDKPKFYTTEDIQYFYKN